MHFTLQERDKLLIFVAAELAKQRLEKGLKLNYPESLALISSFVTEGARAGQSVADLMESARHLLTEEDVMPGIASMIEEVQIEATFPDGTKLVTVHQPIRSFEKLTTPGEYFIEPGELDLVPNRERTVRLVRNTGDRPIQVGSHYHFYEVNHSLQFQREGTVGYRLDIPSGTALRFEPGDERKVTLVQFGGEQKVHGFRGEINGHVDFHQNLLNNNKDSGGRTDVED